MEKSSKRGKIPQRDWPSIIKRYEAGETLASIARTYDCSPPAISYIVSRTRARDMIGEGTTEPSEPGVAKARSSETPPAEGPQLGQVLDTIPEGPAETDTPAVPRLVKSEPTELGHQSLDPTQGADLATAPVPHAVNGPAEGGLDARPATNEPSDGFASASAGQNGGQRRTLHLQLSQSGSPRAEPERDGAPGRHPAGPDEHFAARSSADLPQGLPRPASPTPALDAGIANGGWSRKNSEPHSTRDGGAFIDQALRERVDGEIIAFLAAFDAALAQDTVENRAGLREATDRLLRAGARTRIELERLEARVPLPPREATAYATPAWRSR